MQRWESIDFTSHNAYCIIKGYQALHQEWQSKNLKEMYKMLIMNLEEFDFNVDKLVTTIIENKCIWASYGK